MVDKVELQKAILKPNGEVLAVDYAGLINNIPRNWGLIEALGLFGERFGTQKTFFIGRKEHQETPTLEDRNWEDSRPTLSRGKDSGASFKIPHFPVADLILPSDVDGIIPLTEQLTPGTQLESVARLRLDKTKALRATHAKTHEAARILALATGDVYAPNGTLRTIYGSTVNVYQEWGITRSTATLVTGAGFDPQESIDQLFGDLQDAAYEGDSLSGYICIATPALFAALNRNEYIREQYRGALLNGREELLVGRLGNAVGQDARVRSITLGGITFIEYRAPAFVAAVGDGKGVALPHAQVGRLHFAPANKFDSVNQVSVASYLWETLGQKNDKLELDSETNFAALLENPEQVITVDFDDTAKP